MESVEGDVVHVVADGMPRGTETALLTIGIIGNNVDTWNLGHRVDGQMVVGDITALLLGEQAAIAYFLGGTPHFINNLSCILKRHGFLKEMRTFATNHVEEDAVSRLIVFDMGMGCPILGA